jgi:hypothetical protein
LYSEGLYSLLEVARTLPPRPPLTDADLEGAGAFGQLLREARAWKKEH